MSKTPSGKCYNLPLRNLTTYLNRRSMSYSGESGFSNLTNSPMSNLVNNLSELSTGRSTPRRRLSLTTVDSPPNDCDKIKPESSLSAESGCFSESPPHFIDSPTFESFRAICCTAALHPDIPLGAFSLKKKTIAFRRISSQPLPALRLDSPTDFHDEDENEENLQSKTDVFADDAASQDSGLGLDHDRGCSLANSCDDGASTSSTSSISSPGHIERLPSLEDVWNSMSPQGFKAPKGKPPKRTRSFLEHKQFSEDTCSPLKYSPVKSTISGETSFSGLSKRLFPIGPPKSPTTSDERQAAPKANRLSDDGFQELFHVDDKAKCEGTDQVSSLMSATILHRPSEAESDDVLEQLQFCFPRRAPQDNTPSSWQPVSRRRGFLHRSLSMDVQHQRSSFKRSEPPQDGATPTQSKKWRGDDSTPKIDGKKSNSAEEVPVNPGRRFHRCHSEEAMIKSAVSCMFDQPDLIGDCSRAYCLPIIKGKHQDLKAINPETLSRLLANEYEDNVEEVHIVDCRYPYEFDAGHIQNAVNIYTKDAVIEKYLNSPLAVNDPNKRIIIIFHCEFSSERGPKLSRFLRRLDRNRNKECYPFLHYPEMYLLEGGYKNFFEQYPHLCEPQQYKQMLDKNHSDDLRKFRAKCKSWSDDRSQSRIGMRNLKFPL